MTDINLCASDPCNGGACIQSHYYADDPTMFYGVRKTYRYRCMCTGQNMTGLHCDEECTDFVSDLNCRLV
jgi:hypothetical protein